MTKQIRLEPLESCLLCKITYNGEFAIIPPGGGEAYETVKLHPSEGAVGLRTASDSYNGVVNWRKTGEHVWTST